MLKFSLKYKLICILGIGVLLAFIGQIIFRYYFELPSLVALETHTDRKAVERVRLVIQQLRDNLITSSLDYSTWDDTYEVIELNPGDPAFDRFVGSNFVSNSFHSLKVDGGLFADINGNVKYSSHVDKVDDIFGPGMAFDPQSIEAELLHHSRKPVVNRLINAGISHSNFGPVMFAATHIVTNEPPYPASRGTWIFWRMLDKQIFDAIRENIQIDMDFIELTQVETDPGLFTIFEKLNTSENFLPRNEAGYLYWVLYDFKNHPVYLVKQESDARAFADNLLSNSVLVGFFISTAILIIVILFFTHTVIRRLLYAKKTMQHINNTGDYDKRLLTGSNDEIDAMFTQFNQLLAYIQVQNDELKDQNQKLSELSQQDALTGISNRRYLDEVMERTWRQCARSSSAMSVLMIDVDYFKTYNDKYGHQAGDHVLQQVAQSLQNSLHRTTDYLARYGGEEFCIILTDTKPDAALNVAERLRESIEKMNIRHELSSCAEVVTVSIGIATVTPQDRLIELNMIKAADEALYEAKSRGRNCVYLRNSSQYDLIAEPGGE